MKKIVLPDIEYEQFLDENGRTVYRSTLRHTVLHTIGLDDGRKPKFSKRKGEKVYIPYRNYYNTYVGTAPWPELEEAGYAAHHRVSVRDGKQLTDYYLTDKGLEWLSEELGFKILDEER